MSKEKISLDRLLELRAMFATQRSYNISFFFFYEMEVSLIEEYMLEEFNNLHNLIIKL